MHEQHPAKFCNEKEKYQGIIRIKKHDQKLLEILDIIKRIMQYIIEQLFEDSGPILSFCVIKEKNSMYVNSIM